MITIISVVEVDDVTIRLPLLRVVGVSLVCPRRCRGCGVVAALERWLWCNETVATL